MRGQLPHEIGSIPLWLAPRMMTLKSLPNLNALPGPINITTMIRKHTRFPPTASSLRQTLSPGCSLSHSNFGPLSRDSVTNLMLITVFDAFLTPRSLGVVGLVHKYVNLKEPNNQDIKEEVTTNFLKKRKQVLDEIPNPRALVCSDFQI